MGMDSNPRNPHTADVLPGLSLAQGRCCCSACTVRACVTCAANVVQLQCECAAWGVHGAHGMCVCMGVCVACMLVCGVRVWCTVCTLHV